MCLGRSRRDAVYASIGETREYADLPRVGQLTARPTTTPKRIDLRLRHPPAASAADDDTKRPPPICA